MSFGVLTSRYPFPERNSLTEERTSRWILKVACALSLLRSTARMSSLLSSEGVSPP